MDTEQSLALETAVFAGNILLQSGAEIFRVENTIHNIAKAYGVASFHSFVMSNGVFTTAGSAQEGYFAKVYYTPISTSRLDKIEAVNQLSREISSGMHTPEDAWKRLEEIQDMPKKKPWARILGAGVGSACFCVTFGGTLPDMLASLLAGGILMCYMVAIEPIKLSKITSTIGGSALATLCAVLLWRMGLGNTLSYVVSGSIIPLVPGISFTNAIRDIANGDYIAGSTRMIDALLVAFCIAAGVGLVFGIWRNLLGGGVVL